MRGLAFAKSSYLSRQIGSKVPEVTLLFWIAKILTTAMGEATSDYLVFNINPYIAVMLGAVGFLAAFIVQFVTRRYIASIYWFMVVIVAVFGTMVADVNHIVLGVPYAVSTACFAAALAVIFITWKKSEGTLSIHSIHNRRRELFYWATVGATFALGTAAGDMTATTLHLGYFVSGILFAVLFAVPGICYWLFGLNSIFAFWCAYVLTRPLGASFADWFGKPVSWGALGYGDGLVAALLTVGIVVCVGYMMLRRDHISADLIGGQQPAAGLDS